VGFRLLNMDVNIRYDEALSYYYFSGDSLIQTTHSYLIPNNHVFHNICVWAILSFFPVETWSIRLVAFIAGCFCIPLTYYATIRYYPRGQQLLRLY